MHTVSHANISGETTTSLRASCRYCLWITRLLRKRRHLWRRVPSGTYTHAHLLGYIPEHNPLCVCIYCLSPELITAYQYSCFCLFPCQHFLYTSLYIMFRYGLDVIRIKGSIRDALSELKSSHPHLKAVCMGTRSTDPHSGMLSACYSPLHLLCVCVCVCVLKSYCKEY